MNIAIIGYGKMGHEIEKAAKARGISIKSIIDPRDNDATHKEINEESMNGVDVCIDFTHPDKVIDNIKKISKFGKKMVIGTTGWYGQMDDVKKIVMNTGNGLIWSGNFSIGVNIFFSMVENAAKTTNPDRSGIRLSVMVMAFKHAFDAGWNARGLADIAIIDKHRPGRDA